MITLGSFEMHIFGDLFSVGRYVRGWSVVEDESERASLLLCSTPNVEASPPLCSPLISSVKV